MPGSVVNHTYIYIYELIFPKLDLCNKDDYPHFSEWKLRHRAVA